MTKNQKSFLISRNSSRRSEKRAPHSVNLRIESLESRDLLSVATMETSAVAEVSSSYESFETIELSAATLTKETPSTVVTSAADTIDEYDGKITLREAIEVYSGNGSSITFSGALKGETISLKNGQFTVRQSLSVDASALYDVNDDVPGLTIDAHGQSRIFEVPVGSSLSISGLSLINGSSDEGGAIFSGEHSFLTIANTFFYNNTATKDGGALFASSNTLLTIDDSRFLENTADDGAGGAAYVSDVQEVTTINNTEFRQNVANEGGALYLADSSQAEIKYSTFSANVANSSGGAVFAQKTTLRLEDTDFYGNYALAGSGGAVYQEGMTLQISGGDFYENQSSLCGGSIYVYGAFGSNSNRGGFDGKAEDFAFEDKFTDNLHNSEAEITGARFFNNTSQQGGAVYVDGLFFKMARTRINHNFAKQGSAFYANNSSGDFSNVLIYDNQFGRVGAAPAYGFGVALYSNNSSLHFYNATIANNGDVTDASSLFFSSGKIEVYNSIILNNTFEEIGVSFTDSNYSDNSTHFSFNCLLTRVQDGLTKGLTSVYDFPEDSSLSYLFTDSDAGDYSLVAKVVSDPLFVSPAINRGSNRNVAGAMANAAYDLVGNMRVIDGTADLGALEYNPSAGLDVGTASIVDYNASTQQATLRWDEFEDAASYMVKRRENGQSEWSVYSSGVKNAYKTINNMVPGKTYVFRVEGYTRSGTPLNYYHETTFSPINLKSETGSFELGDTLSLTLTAANPNDVNLRWYYVSEGQEDQEILEAAGLKSYVPTQAFDVKVVATGSGASDGIVSEYTFVHSESELSQTGDVVVSSYDSATGISSLRWDPIPNAAYYQLQISQNGGDWIVCNSEIDASCCSTSIGGIYAGASYQFRVYGLTSSGQRLNSFKEGILAPISLSSTTTSFSSGDEINVVLDAADNASAEFHWYYVDSNGVESEIDDIPPSGVSYVPTDPNGNIVVVAVGTDDSLGSYSRFVIDYTPVIGKVEVQGYTHTIAATTSASSGNSATVVWDAIAGASSYTLQLSNDGGLTWSDYATNLKTTSAQINYLYVGSSYDFRVVGINAEGSVLASYDKGTFAPIALTSANYSYKYAADSEIEITLHGAKNADAYIKWYLVTPGGDEEIVSARGDFSYKPTSTTYDVKAVATGANASAGSSSAITFTRPDNVGTVATTSYNAEQRQATLSWEPLAAAKSYQIVLSRDGGLKWETMFTGLTNLEKTLSAIFPTQTYIFRVYGESRPGKRLENAKFYEGTFAPFVLTSSTGVYSAGETINVALKKSSLANVNLQWYYVAEEGDRPIDEAEGQFSFAPAEAYYDIKVVATGLKASEGGRSELVFTSPITMGRVTVENYDAASGQMTLFWNKILYADDYTLEITGDGWDFSRSYMTKYNRIVVNDLPSGAAYRFKVTASRITKSKEVLGSYNEGRFAPVALTASTEFFDPGDVLSVSLPDSVSGKVRWYHVTSAGDVEIPEAEGLLQYAPTIEGCDVKAVVTGTGVSFGSVSEVIFKSNIRPASFVYNTSNYSAILSWNEVEGAQCYKLYKYQAAKDLWVAYHSDEVISEPSTTVVGLYLGGSYSFRIYSVDINGLRSTNYQEATFAPIALKSLTNAADTDLSFTAGQTLSVTLTKAENAQADIRWYRQTDEGDVEIQAAAGSLQYTPDSDEYPVKVVARGVGDSTGSYDELIFAREIAFDYNLSTHKVLLSWTPTEGAVKYKIKISKNGGATWANYKNAAGESALSETSAIVNGLYPNKTYGFRIYTVDEHNKTSKTYRETSFSVIGLTVAGKSVSYAPYGAGQKLAVVLKGNADSSADIRWYFETPDGDVEIVDARGMKEYTPSDATYNIKVIATGTGMSAGSNATVTFNAPLAFRAYDALTRKATLSWNPIDSATSYVVKIFKNDEWQTVKKGIVDVSTELVGLYATKSYRYRVYGMTESGSLISYSEGTFAPFVLKSSVDSYRIGATVSLTLQGPEEKSADVRWYEKTDSGDREIEEAAGKLEYAPVHDKYDIKIVATGTGDSQGVTSEVTIVSTAQPLFFDYDASTNKAILSWRTTPGAASYTVKISKDGGATWINYRKGVADDFVEVASGLYPGRSYGFRVYSVDANNQTFGEYKEATFAPITAAFSAAAYVRGETLSATVNGSEVSSYLVKWYNVTDAGDQIIPEATGQLEYTPSIDLYDVKVVVTGTERSAGCNAENTFATSAKAVIFDYDSSTHKAEVSWRILAGAETYMIKKSSDGGSTWITYVKGIAGNSAVVSGLYTTKSYDFRIYGVDSSGKTLPVFYETNYAPIDGTTTVERIETALAAAPLLDEGTVPSGELILIKSEIESNGDVSPDLTTSGVVNIDSYNAVTRQATVSWNEIPGASTYLLRLSTNGGLSWNDYATSLTELQKTVNSISYDKSLKFRVYGVASDGTLLDSYSEGAFAPVQLKSSVDSYAVGDKITVEKLGYDVNAIDVKWYYVTSWGDEEIVEAQNQQSYTPSESEHDIKVVATAGGSSSTLVFSRLVEEAPSTVVTSTEDLVDPFDGVVTLREALEVYAQEGSVVTFASSLYRSTIELSGEIKISHSVTVDAGSLCDAQNDVPGIAVSGSAATRVFYVAGPTAETPSVRINALALIDGQSSTQGGAVYVDHANLAIENSTFSGNVALNDGGAIFAKRSSLSIVKSSLYNNASESNGGAIYAYQSTVSIDDADLYQNRSGSRGGAVDAFTSAILTINDARIYGNVAGDGGAISAQYGSTTTVTSSKIYGNQTTTGSGGAFFLKNADLNLGNSLLYENVSTYGDALRANQGTVELRNATIANNGTEGSAGALYLERGANVYAYNTIVADNAGDDFVKASNFRGSINAYHVLSGFTQWSADSAFNVEYDPETPLFTDTNSGDYTLAEGSPAIDQGDDAYAAMLPFDLAGSERISSSAVDLGAYESTLTKIGVSNYDSSTGRATLSWSAIAGAVSYHVETSNNGGASWTRILSSVAGTSAEAGSFDAGTSYNLRVLGLDASGNVLDSTREGAFAPVSVSTTQDSFIPGTTVVVELTKAPEAQVEIRWYYVDANGGAEEIFEARGLTSYAPTSRTRGVRIVATGVGISSGSSSEVAVPVNYREEHSLVVNSLADVVDETDGVVTLREAVEVYAVDGGAITFDESLRGKTIVLENGFLRPTKSLRIDASSFYDAENQKPGLTIDANQKSAIFDYEWVNLEIDSLAFTNGFGVWGGAIATAFSTLTIKNSSFYGNKAEGHGGAISGGDTIITISNSDFYQNVSPWNGGAICVEHSSTVIVDNSKFYENKSDWGGAICGDGSKIVVRASELYNNYGSIAGGAFFFCSGAEGAIENSLLYGNIADGGSAIRAYTSNLVFNNDTIANNTGSPAIQMLDAFDVHSTNIYNTIFANNNGGDVEISYEYHGTFSGYNVLSSFTGWTNSDGVNYVYDANKPLFVDADNHNYNLANDSQAVNRGSNVYTTYTRDFAGNDRIVNGVVDLGAMESQYTRIEISGYEQSDQTATLSWDPIDGASRYNVQFKMVGDDAWENCATNLEETSLVKEGLEIGKSYQFRVYDAADPGVVTEINFTPVGLESVSSTYSVGTPVFLTVTGADDVSCEIRWYYVTPDGDVEIVDAQDQRRFVPYNNVFDVKAVATGILHSSGSSASLIFKSAATVGKVEAINYDAATCRASLRWDAIDGAVSYNLLISEDEGKHWPRTVSNITGTELSLDGLEAGKTYFFKITGVNAGGAALAGGDEGAFAPIILTAPIYYTDGRTIRLTVDGSAYSTLETRWYYVTPEGDIEITDSRDRLFRSFELTQYDVKIVSRGTGFSTGSDQSVTVRVSSLETPSLVVNSLDDVVDDLDRVITLREAVEVYAVDGATITFDASLSGKTILLKGTPINVTKDLTIDASALYNEETGVQGITIDAQRQSAHFNATMVTKHGWVDPRRFEINGLKLVNGDAGNGPGGSIQFNGRATGVIRNSAFINNNSSGGGAIGLVNSNVTIVNSSFNGNTGHNGGAIEIRASGVLNAENVTFNGNSANFGGAICMFDYAVANLSRVVFSGNTTLWDGGTINVGNASLSVENTVFHSNQGLRGSAIYSDEYTAKIDARNVTIVNNVSTNGQGAICLYGSTDATIFNSIVLNNEGGDVFKPDDFPGTINGNNVLSSFAGWTNSDGANYVYDPNKSLFVDAANNDYRLANGSQAVNKGSNHYEANALDLAGDNRTVNGSVDLGAYESRYTRFEVSSYAPIAKTATLSWDPIDGASAYNVQFRRTGDDVWETCAANLEGTSLVKNALEPGESYQFRVYDAAISIDEATDSGVVTVIGFASVEMTCDVTSYSVGTPVVLTVKAAEGTSYAIRWYYATADGDVEIVDARDQLAYTPSNNAFDLKAVLSGILYDSENSYSLTFRSEETVGRVEATSYDATTGRASLRWDAIVGAASYDLLISEDEGVNWSTTLSNVTGTETSVDGLEVGKTYFFRVVGVNAGGTALAGGDEGAFAPLKLTAPDVYMDGRVVRLTVDGSVYSASETYWYYVTPEGDEEITDARGELLHRFELAPYDVKVVLKGWGLSAGGDQSVIVAVSDSEAPSLVVNSFADVIDDLDGVITLREAVEVYSVEGDTITFDESLRGKTIVLENGVLKLEKSLRIDASSLYDAENQKPGLTIDADEKSPIFDYLWFDLEIDSLALTNGSGEWGGAIVSSFSTLTIKNSSLYGNKAEGHGGAIFGGNTVITIYNSDFFQNVSPWQGGAICVEHSSTVIVENSKFYGNESSGGGAICGDWSNIVVRASEFYDNYSSGTGGAFFFLSNAKGSIENSLLYGNIGAGGSVLSAANSSVVLNNDTIVNNSGSSAIQMLDAFDVYSTNIYNTILAGNIDGDVAIDPRYQGAFAGYNVLSSFTGWTNTDGVNYVYDSNSPLFVDSDNNNYNLTNGSQAVNRGSNVYVTSERDCVGNVRIVNGVADLGALESQYTRIEISGYEQTDQTATLTWNAIDGASRYNVQFRMVGDDAWETCAANFEGTSLVKEGLEIGESYQFRVYDAANPDVVTEVSFAPVGLECVSSTYSVGTPVSLAVTGADDVSCEIRWYYVTPDGDVEIVDARGRFRYSPCNSAFDVKAVATGIRRSLGSSASLTFKSAATVGKVEAINYDAAISQASLRWDAIDGAVSYNLLISEDEGVNCSRIVPNVTGTELSLDGLESGKTYFFKIIGVNADGTELAGGDEGAFAPIRLTAPTFYTDGRTIRLTVDGSGYSTLETRWYYVTPEGDEEITEARNKLLHSFELAPYNVKVVLRGTGFSTGSDQSVTVRVASLETPSLIVNSTEDVVDDLDGVITLREAIEVYAFDGDTITFDESLRGKTILLDGADIDILKDLTVDASALYNEETGVQGITIDAQRQSAHFNATMNTQHGWIDPKRFEINGLKLVNGDVGNGSQGALQIAGGATVVIKNSAFENNFAGAGGAINLTVSTVTIINSSFENNRGDFGGAISGACSTLNVENVSFHGNSANNGGAVFLRDRIVANFTNVVFSENTTYQEGGTINNTDQANLSIENAAFYKNQGPCGAALYSIGDTTKLDARNVTIVDNVSTNGQGAVCLYDSTDATISNSIVLNNEGGDVFKPDDFAGTINGNNVLSSFAGWTNSDGVNYVYDPNRSLFVDAANNDYRLANGSQAVNKGSNAYVGESTTTDLADDNRIVNGVVDLGAYESRYTRFEVSSYAPTAKTATLSWDPIDGASAYNVQFRRTGDNVWETCAANFAGTSLVKSELEPGESYQFRVYDAAISIDEATDSDVVTVIGFAPVEIACDVTSYAVGTPVVLTVKAAEGTSYAIRWYYVTSDGDVEIVSARDQLAYTPSNNVFDIKTVVSGVHNASENAFSLILTSEEIVGKVEATSYDATTSRASLRWDAIVGADSYNLLISEDEGVNWSRTVSNVSGTKTSVDGLEAGKTYFFRVVGVNAGGTALAGGDEGAFAPLKLTAPDVYTNGRTINLTVDGSLYSSYETYWYYVTSEGDEEITDARGKLFYNFELAQYDVKVVLRGSGFSTGGDQSVAVRFASIEEPSLIVNSLADVVDNLDGVVTLREAVEVYAVDDGTISFDESLRGKTIVLENGALRPTKSLRIDASSFYDAETQKPGLTIDANQKSAIFDYEWFDLEIDSLAFTNGSGGWGGAIATSSSTLTIKNSSFYDNVAEGHGGAIFGGDDAVITICNSDFCQNVSPWNGGAIYVEHSSTVIVDNSRFYENESDWGGAICGDGSKIVVRASEFYNNYGSIAGGAFFFCNGAKGSIENSLLYGNIANGGSVIRAYDSNLVFNNDTIANNLGSPAIQMLDASDVYSTKIYNTIFADNIDGDVEIFNEYHGAFSGYNVLSSFTEWTNWDGVNYVYDASKPLFVDSDNDDYRLANGSQAIDKGSDSFVSDSMTTDLDGNARIQGAAVDLGAYEAPASANNGSTTSILDEAFAEFFEEDPFDDEF